LNPGRIWYWSCKAYQKKLKPVAWALKTFNYFFFRCILPFQAQIEKDIVLEHYGLGVCVHPNVTIGKGVTLYHHVSLAAETWVGSPHRIVIEDDVTIGAHAIVLGNNIRGIRIGKGATIGAGALVVRDVEPGQTVVTMPARPVRVESEKPASSE
jgi:serine O-acetyltransferase